MPQAIDMDYCMIVIDKLISPHTPVEQVEPLLRDLMDSVYHPQMKDLAQKIVDPELDIVERRKLREKFRNFDHGGANDFSEVNYKELIDKLLDPNLPDQEYKPTMKALLDGDLDQDKKNMVSAIISCQNKEQKANMVKRFKSLFDREKEERERALKERAEAKAAKEKEKAELEANLLKFSDDGMTLIYKFLDKKIPREKKTEIYDRLMEPDIDAEIKNLAIQLVNATKASERPQLIEDFKKRREEEKIAAVKRKEDEARRKAEEEKENKDLKMQRKQQLLSQKKKSDMMKKRDLMLKYRAEERKREGVAGPSSVQEREDWRRREREKMRLEILRFREESRLKMMKQEREDRLKQGWLVTTFDSSYNVNIQVVVPDLACSLAPAEQQQYKAALAALNLSQVSQNKPEPEKPKEISPEEKKPEQKPEQKPEKSEDKVDEEFEKYFKIFVDPSLTEEAESSHVKQLIKDKKSALVRSLAVRLASVPGAGKSKVFQTLIKKFCPEKVNSNQPPVIVQKEKAEVEAKESPPEVTGEPSQVVNGAVIKENGQEVPKETVVIQNNPKRRLSQDSNSGNESKKLKLVDVFEDDKGKEVKEENDESSTDKKKKKKHKHKDDKEKERQDDNGERRGEKRKKKHKNKEKHKKKEREKDTEKSEGEKHRSSTESKESKSGSDSIKPLLEMSQAEMKQRFKLKNFNARVRIKNCRKLFRVIQKQDEERDRRWEERSKESDSSTRQKTRSPSRPKSSASNNSVRSRSNTVKSKSPRSRSNSARSKSPRSRSRSNSVKSRSPIRSRSNSLISRSPSRSRSVISRSPRSNSSRSRSPLRSNSYKSRSSSPIRSPSITSRSRSNSP